MYFEYSTVLWLFCIPEIFHYALPKLCLLDTDENSLHTMCPFTFFNLNLDIKHESEVHGCLAHILWEPTVKC